MDIAIIGGGPAGLTAGLYAARAGCEVVLYERSVLGGQVINTMEIENYPGFEEAIDGPSLMMKLERQATRFGLQIRYETVEALTLREDPKIIHTARGEQPCRAVILCMGAQPRLLGLPAEARLKGRGVSYCAVCDGALFRGRPVAVIGGGDTAAEDALYLSKFCPTVYLVHRRDALRATQVLQRRVLEQTNIQPVWEHTPQDITGDNQVEGLVVAHTKTGQTQTLEVSGIFVAIGSQPENQLLHDVRMTDSGQVVTGPDMATGIPGVFCAGDLRQTPLRQIVTAAADGAVAALAAEKYLYETREKL